MQLWVQVPAEAGHHIPTHVWPAGQQHHRADTQGVMSMVQWANALPGQPVAVLAASQLSAHPHDAIEQFADAKSGTAACQCAEFWHCGSCATCPVLGLMCQMPLTAAESTGLHSNVATAALNVTYTSPTSSCMSALLLARVGIRPNLQLLQHLQP